MKSKCLSFLLVLAMATGNTIAQSNADVDNERYVADQDECTQEAQQAADTGASAATSAVGVAIIGGILGSLFGRGGDAGTAALAGAIIGATGGAAAADKVQKDAFRNCMTNRNYIVD